MSSEVLMIIVSIAINGLVQTFITAHVLKTDMHWVKRELERLDAAMIRGHQRIDYLEKQHH